MANWPPMPLNTTGYLADTMHLTDAEHGTYMLMLMHLWRSPKGRLADDENRLMRVCRCSPSEWKARRRMLGEFFRVNIAEGWTLGKVGSRHVDMAMHPCRTLDGDWSQVREIIFARDGYFCSYCGTSAGPFEIDHKHPRSRGGTNDHENLTVSCRTCNRSKRAMTVEEWMERV